MLSELRFASFLSYLPKAKSDDEILAKQWMYRIKSDKTLRIESTGEILTTSEYLARRISFLDSNSPCRSILRSDVILVPVPGCGRQRPGTLWVAERLSISLQANGLGAQVMLWLKRETPVQKSAFANPGERPSVGDHYSSFKTTDANLAGRGAIVLVDDVITRGATMLAAAIRMNESFPNHSIAGFAMLRTMGYSRPFESYVHETSGTITRNEWGDSERNP
jgi:hypothetical protein